MPAPNKIKFTMSGIQCKNCQADEEVRICDPESVENSINRNRLSNDTNDRIGRQSP